MQLFRVYIFDFDGTVADTCKDVWNSVEYACSCHGLSLPPHIREDSVNLALSSAEIYRLAAGKADEHAEEVFAQQVRYHYRSLNDFGQTRLYPDMDRLLTALGRRAACHVASNKAQTALDRLLRHKGWENYFTSALGTVPDRTLPKEKMIENIIDTYQGITRSDVLFIGDSYTDIIAARANGIQAAGVTYGDGSPERLLAEKPDYVADSSTALYHLLTDTH